MSNRTALLVSMPWALADAPSIQIGVLQASLADAGIDCDVLHLDLQFAKRIGPDLYARLQSEFSLTFLCEWLFAGALGVFGEIDDFLTAFSDRAERYRAAVTPWEPHGNPLERLLGPGYRESLQAIRDEHAPRFIAELVEEHAGSHDVVGFSCMFSQTIPSLALARAWKERDPGAVMVLGGSSVQGEMGEELLRVYPFVDLVVDGEGERAIREVVERARADRDGLSAEPPAGVITRRGEVLVRGPARPPLALDDTPIPDYGTWFEQAEVLGLGGMPHPRVYFEGSRGCWWGAVRPCTFCGLNGEVAGYRAKSPARTLLELVHLTSRYRTLRIAAVDTVASKAIFEEVLPRLAALGLDLQMFYEVRPTLKRAEVERLAAAGVSSIQPGIESFSTRVLQLMHKGTSSLINVQILKWCRELGIDATYNLLWGFPGEDPADYSAMTKLLPLLAHLQPPAYPPRLLGYQRYSAYFKESRSGRGPPLVPRAEYRALFPPELDVGRVAYYFEHPLEQDMLSAGYVRDVAAALACWHRRYYSSERPYLVSAAGLDFVEVSDTRDGELRTTMLSGAHARTLLACDAVVTRDALLVQLRTTHHVDITSTELNEIVSELAEAGFLLAERQQILSLVLPRRALEREIGFSLQVHGALRAR